MKRIKYIDILRGWAVLLMVFWHLDEALISDAIRQTTIFDISQFIGGLVAPLFLFTSGSSNAILIFKKRDSLISFTPVLRKRIIRILQIFVVAYLLHLPEGDFWKIIISRTGEAYNGFVKTDILQVIAVSLLLLQFLFLIIKRTKPYFYIINFIGIFAVLITPFVWQIDFIKILPVELASYFNIRTGSLFPLFPWLAYVFMGASVMQLLLENQEKQKKILKMFFIYGLAMIFVGSAMELLSIKSTPYYDFWQTSPNIFLIKFGIVLIMVFGFSWLCEKFNYDMKIFNVFGKESLFIYVVHLLIIYGTKFYTLQTIFGRTLNWLEFGILYFVMIFLLLFLAKGWGKLKTHYRERVSSKP
jgi:uncharacterized membrane protein